jgi:CMP-N-acetylneuraminic acid synthetase
MFDFNFKIIIPVKGNSERVKNKNALPFGDKPTMLEWKISQLLEVFKPSDIVVSTDFEPFKEIARNNGLLLHERKNPILSDEKHINYKFSDLVFDVISSVDADNIAWLPVTCPLITSSEYKYLFEIYRSNILNNSKYDSLITTQLQKEYFWDEEKPINYSLSKHVPSQSLPNWYKLTNGLFLLPKKVAMSKKYIVGEAPYRAEVSKLAGLDIDYPEDYEIAKALYPLYLEKNKK